MKKVIVLFVVALGFVQATSASAEEGGQSADEARTYVVQYRDSVETVARRFGVTVEEIISANPGAVSRRPICVDEREWTLRSGTVVTTCRRTEHWFRRAGMTITIPTSRAILEAELVALRAERDKAREERDNLRDENGRVAEERDTLRDERDHLAAANAELAKANAAMAESNNQAARRADEAETTAEANSIGLQTSEIESHETAVIAMAIVCGLVVVLAIVFVWWSRRPLRELERDRAHFELTRQTMVKEAEDLAKRWKTLDVEEKRLRLAFEEEQTRQKALRDQLTRWEEDWLTRNDRQNARKREQDDQGRLLAGRKAACEVKEAANTKREAELDAEKQRQEKQVKELADKEHGVEALRQALSAQKARQDRKDTEQEQREADLLKGFEDLRDQLERLHVELDGRRQVLDDREAEVDGKVRMFDQDIQPQLVANADRAAALASLEKAVAVRERALRDGESDLGLRLEEFQEARGNFETRETTLHVDEQELERRQIALANEREQFEKEMAAAKQEIEAAGGLKKAKGILDRAKKKAAIVRDLDKREKAVVAAEQALAEARRALAEAERAVKDREANLQTWSDRLADKERELARGEDDVPTVVTGQGLAIPPPLPEPDERSLTGIDMRAQGLPRQIDSVDIVGATRYEVPGGENPPASAVRAVDGEDRTSSDEDITCATCGEHFPDRRSFDAHRVVKPDCRNATPNTPTIRPPKGQPTARTGSRLYFYCATCRRDVPLDDQEAHYAAHRAQDAPGPLSPPKDKEE